MDSKKRKLAMTELDIQHHLSIRMYQENQMDKMCKVMEYLVQSIEEVKQGIKVLRIEQEQFKQYVNSVLAQQHELATHGATLIRSVDRPMGVI